MLYFDDVLMTYRKAKGLGSWEATAKALGLTDQGLRDIRKGRGAVKEERVKEIMLTTGIPAPLIVAAWQAEHAKDDAVRKSWGELLECYKVECRPQNNIEGNQEFGAMCIMLSQVLTPHPVRTCALPSAQLPSP